MSGLKTNNNKIDWYTVTHRHQENVLLIILYINMSHNDLIIDIIKIFEDIKLFFNH